MQVKIENTLKNKLVMIVSMMQELIVLFFLF